MKFILTMVIAIPINFFLWDTTYALWKLLSEGLHSSQATLGSLDRAAYMLAGRWILCVFCGVYRIFHSYSYRRRHVNSSEPASCRQSLILRTDSMPELSIKIPAVEKLLDYTASGVGAIAGPMLAPWRASREAKARLASARIDSRVKRIEAESEAETSAIIAKARSDARNYLVTPDADVKGTAEFTRDEIIQRIEFQERKRLMNVKSVVEGAADELGEKEVSNHEPDPDWTARFFDCVQDVSSEDMQKLWARVLAGEVESPGRTSLRTLDTLKNLTKRDAEMFRDICQFIMGWGLFVLSTIGGRLKWLSFRQPVASPRLWLVSSAPEPPAYLHMGRRQLYCTFSLKWRLNCYKQ